VFMNLEDTDIVITTGNIIADKVVGTTKSMEARHTIVNFVSNMFSFMYSFVVIPFHIRNSNYSSYFINTELFLL
jgi:hypothetical protein